MIRKILATLAVAAALTAPLRAELKYTMRMEVHKSTVPPRGEPDPIMAMLSAMVANALLPSGPVEMSLTWNEDVELRGSVLTTTEERSTSSTHPPGTATVVVNVTAGTVYEVRVTGSGATGLAVTLTPR